MTKTVKSPETSKIINECKIHISKESKICTFEIYKIIKNHLKITTTRKERSLCYKTVVNLLRSDDKFILKSNGSDDIITNNNKIISDIKIKATSNKVDTNLITLKKPKDTMNMVLLGKNLEQLAIDDDDKFELQPNINEKTVTLQQRLSSINNNSFSTDTQGGVKKFFYRSKLCHFEKDSKNHSLISGCKNATYFQDSALLGQLSDQNDEGNEDDKSVFMNTNEPFCLVAVGTQGNGKSHTVACVLESCLVPYPEENVINLKSPMNAVVFHYDSNINYVCEATGLIWLNRHLEQTAVNEATAVLGHLPTHKLTILVSPLNYYNRLHFYQSDNDSGITVKPLLFDWKELTAEHIKKIMGIDESGTQLYMASLLEVLRNYQRKGLDLPDFDVFVEEVKRVCTVQGQSGPLDQRLNLLASLIKESAKNSHIEKCSSNLQSCCCEAGTLVIVDLSDQLLSKQDANGIFQVLAEQYCALNANTPEKQQIGKLLVIDEAHKFMDGVSTDGLSNAIVNIARLMRHEGIRLVVSTQSPKALAPELLELSSISIMHGFSSRDWFEHLKSKLPLSPEAFHRIMDLERGEALIHVKKHSILDGHAKHHNVYGKNVFSVFIRPRVTRDLGGSIVNIHIK